MSSGANSNNGCKKYVGKKATGKYNSCDHDGCTEVKNKARANLRLGVASECQKYITSTTPCVKYHC